MLEEQLKNHREVHQKQLRLLRLLRLSPSKQKRLEEAIVRKENFFTSSNIFYFMNSEVMLGCVCVFAAYTTQNETHNRGTVNPPGQSPPTTQGRPMPRTFLSDREHDTGPLHPCSPPNLSLPPSSIHHICPPVSITSSQWQLTQRKEKAKKRGEEYSRYHAEQCWPEDRPLSWALPLLAWSLQQTHPLLPGNNSPEAWGMDPGCGGI
ncbi:hypothetical protein EYF80_001848 [Liparis tanakae]|uniref:Uncharacterized protein n=1 Tax=Liparis tanakae TaxID=230148 RepID=A0A4Z2JDH0_9TELE|nr:hypothetical protein EYF80_001848 [Liparis tanakae]